MLVARSSGAAGGSDRDGAPRGGVSCAYRQRWWKVMSWAGVRKSAGIRPNPRRGYRCCSCGPWRRAGGRRHSRKDRSRAEGRMDRCSAFDCIAPASPATMRCLPQHRRASRQRNDQTVGLRRIRHKQNGPCVMIGSASARRSVGRFRRCPERPQIFETGRCAGHAGRRETCRADQYRSKERSPGVLLRCRGFSYSTPRRSGGWEDDGVLIGR